MQAKGPERELNEICENGGENETKANLDLESEINVEKHFPLNLCYMLIYSFRTHEFDLGKMFI